MNRSSWLAAGAAAVAAAVIAGLGGCSVLSDALSPSPSPSSSATGSATPAATPSESRTDRIRRLDKEAAEQAYLTFQQEFARLAEAGGSDKPTKVLTENAAGEYLRFHTRELQAFRAEGQRTDRPASVRVGANQGWSASELGLTACEDNLQVRILDRSGREVLRDRDRRFVQSLIAKKTDGTWRIASLKSKIVKTFDNESGCT